MDNFAKLVAAERTPFFEETASRRSSTTTAVEKDFWVCWTLKHLFALKHVPELRFKGGTSLSKVFRLIDRFSEDIDISMDRAALGFTGERDLAHPQLSTTNRKALDAELREAITKEVTSDLLPKLRTSFEPILKKQKWMLAPSEEANEEMTLVFYYPRAFDYKDYLRPQIKLEFGRGDQQPSEKAPVISFVAEEFPKEFAESFVEVTVLDAQRTFWEKVTLLHAENHRPDPSKLKPRMSRHWSDVAVMSVSDRFVNEKLSLDLLRTVIRFKQIYFAANWAKYEDAVPGTIRIVPNEHLRKVLRDDYVQMKEMLPVGALTFDQILEKLDALELRLNALAAAR
jgi:hypothetical protein